MTKKNNWLLWLIALLLAAGLVRLGFWFSYSPRHTSDLQGYLDVAKMITHMDFSHNEGARTPIYPALLVLGGLTEKGAWIVQMGLGLLISTLLFVFTWKTTKHAPLAFSVALIYSLNIPQLFFEATLVAETLSTFLLLLALGLAAWIDPRRKGAWPLAMVWGAITAAAVLTRPMYIYLCPLFFIFLYGKFRKEPARARWGILSAWILPLALIVGGWSAVNWATTGYFGPTTMTGYYLMNHTGNFIEYAPDQYAVVRDIYLRHRAEQIATTGNQGMTVWRSFYDLINATGTSYAGLSQLLTQLSLALIVQHPFLYLQSVTDSWISFWKVTNFWDVNLIHDPLLIPPLEAVWQTERWLTVGVNILFILLGVFWLWQWIRRKLEASRVPLFLIWILVMCGSVFQAFLERGDNARYAVSFEVLMIWTVAMVLWDKRNIILHASGTQPPAP